MDPTVKKLVGTAIPSKPTHFRQRENPPPMRHCSEDVIIQPLAQARHAHLSAVGMRTKSGSTSLQVVELHWSHRPLPSNSAALNLIGTNARRPTSRHQTEQSARN